MTTLTAPMTGDWPRSRFSYGVFRALLRVLGMGPGLSRVELDGRHPARAHGLGVSRPVPVHQITAAEPRSGLVGGIGVHGWRGRWLVNGAITGLVALTIDPAVRALATGIPVQLRELTLSLEEPDAFVAALGR